MLLVLASFIQPSIRGDFFPSGWQRCLQLLPEPRFCRQTQARSGGCSRSPQPCPQHSGSCAGCPCPQSPAQPSSARLSSVQPSSASRWCCSAGNERPGGTYLPCTVSRLILEAGCTFLLLQKIIFWLLRGGKKKKVSLMMPRLIIQPLLFEVLQLYSWGCRMLIEGCAWV